MFPSKIPVVYVVHMVIVGIAIIAAIMVGHFLNQPLALLSLLALNFLPSSPQEFPLVPQGAQDEEDSNDDYDGSSTFGFSAPAEEDADK